MILIIDKFFSALPAPRINIISYSEKCNRKASFELCYSNDMYLFIFHYLKIYFKKNQNDKNI